MSTPQTHYDAILFHSFGGPEAMDEVMPYLQRVTAGRGVPQARLEAVATHYYARGGVSPINAQNRDIIARLTDSLARRGIHIPIVFANRNSAPFLADVVAGLEQRGARHILQFVTAGFSCYSGCRQYREDLQQVCAEQGFALQVDKIRVFHNHPRFIAAQRALLESALATLAAAGHQHPVILCSAHSIPRTMADHSAYEAQLHAAAALITADLPVSEVAVVYQSRSGNPRQPWLEPDIGDALRERAARDVRAVVVVPLGFVSDHMEVINDLDDEAAHIAATLGRFFVRIPTVAAHADFIEMISDLVTERIAGGPPAACGPLSAAPDRCPADCCLRGAP